MLLLRDLTIQDIESVVSIVELNWGEDISIQARYEMLEMFNKHARWNPHYYVVECDGHVVGCAGYRDAWIMTHVYELIWINVHPEYRGHGIGIALTQKRIDRIKELGGSLIMLMTQKAGFFRKFGFESAKVFDGWHLMTKQLGTVNIGKRIGE